MSNTNIKFYKVQSLPATGVVGGVYFCKTDKKVYIYTDSGWEDYAGTVDETLDADSSNPVENAAVCEGLNSKSNVGHTHTKAEVGLGNVDNTADANKSVKYATSAGSATTATTAASAAKLTTPRTIALGTGVTSTATSFSGESNITIPVNSIKESYLDWGGKDIAGRISPVDAAMSSFHSANRAQFCKPAGVTIEYSTDGGTTWIDYGATDSDKINLLSDNGKAFYIGKKTSATASNPATLNDKLRITLNATNMGIYTGLKKILLNVSTSGATGCTVMIEYSKNASKDTWITYKSSTPIAGWSAWNTLNVDMPFGATAASNWANIRMTFSIGGVSSSYASNLAILNILLFGDTYWLNPSIMAKTGHLYSYDANQNALFPAAIYEGGTSSAYALANKYAAKSHTHTKSQITDFPASLKNPNAITIKGNSTEIASYDGSAAKTVNISGSGATTVSADTSSGTIVVNSTDTDTKVTSVDNHYTPTGTTTKSASGGTVTDITNSSSGTNVVTGVTMDAKGHVTGVTSLALKSTNTQTITGVKGSAESSFRTGNVNITPANLGITVVNNTADANKNVASAGKLTTARNLKITDGTNTGDATSFNGTSDVNIKLPSEIIAGVTVPYNKTLKLGEDSTGIQMQACDDAGDTVTSEPTGIAFSSEFDTVLLKNISDPIDGQDAATKLYVDTAVTGINPTLIGAATAAQGAKADTAIQHIYANGSESGSIVAHKYLTVSSKVTSGGTSLTETPYQTIDTKMGELPSSGAAPVDQDSSQMIIANYTEGLLGAKAIGNYVHNAMTNYGTAVKLTNARTIKITGEYYYSQAQFDGSADITFNMWRKNTMWLTSASTATLTGEGAHQIIIAGTSAFTVTLTLPNPSEMATSTNHGVGECYTIYKMFPNSTLVIKSYGSSSNMYVGGSSSTAARSSLTISGGSCRVVKCFYSGIGTWYIAIEALASS